MSRSLLAATMRRGARAALVAAVVLLAGAASAAVAAPTWLAPFDPLPASSGFPSHAMNAGGEVLFADRSDLGGGKSAFRVSSRPPGGSVGAPVSFPPAGSATLGFSPALALADDGHAILAWSDGGGAFYALRSPAGTWGAVTALPGAANVTNVVAGIDATGRATVGWAENTNPGVFPGDMNVNFATVEVVRISSSGSVSGSQTLLAPPGGSQVASVAMVRVAGSGPAIFVYGLGFLGFTSQTIAFRDTATGNFGDAADLGVSSVSSASADVADSGRATVVQPMGANIALRVREPGGALGLASNVGGQGNVFSALVGLAGDGAITLVWMVQAGADTRVLACTVAGSDCAGDPQQLSVPSDGSVLGLSSLDVNAAGAALAAWSTLQTSPVTVFRARAALRPAPDAAFGPAQDVAPPPAQSAGVALDAAGDGVATYNAATGATPAPKAAGLDATGPRIEAFDAPGSVAQGALAGFAASASDVWSPFGLSWSFGDGAAGVGGGSVTHAFAAAGSFPVTVTATDAVGNSSSRSAVVVVRDTVSPRIERLTVTHARFRVGAGATAKVAAAAAATRRRAGRRAIPRGTTFRYTLSEAGRATFAIDRAVAGRRAGRACKKPTHANRRRRACRRYVRAGVLTRHAKAGANALAFSGRIGRKALAPGGYRLTLTVRDAAGNASRPKSLTFTIVS